MQGNKKTRRPHVLRTEDGVDIPVCWADIVPTGQSKVDRKVYQLNGSDTEGILIRRLELEEEQANRVDGFLKWIENIDIPPEPRSGLDTLIDAWKE